MSYVPRLPPPAQRDFREFVLDHFDETEARLEAIDRLNVLIERIASEPTEMGTTAPGPIPGMVCVQQISVGELQYPVRVAYELSEDEKAVVITGIGFQPL